jgi:endo-1,4-beta-D-glucanase Y
MTTLSNPYKCYNIPMRLPTKYRSTLYLTITLLILSLTTIFTTSHLLPSSLLQSNSNPPPKYPEILSSTWQYYKQNFIQDGRVIDPYQDNLTTSEGQSYAMLRAVFMNDRTTFDQVWSWTRTYLTNADELFAWKWNYNTIQDPASATDADQDIALALILAYQKWNYEPYSIDARKTINAIWRHEVAFHQDQPYLLAGSWANRSELLILNPSYFSPVNYRYFALLHPHQDWMSVINTSYQALQGCTQANLTGSPGSLPPDWCALSKATSTYVASPNPQGTDFSFDAIRTPMRISIDYMIFNESRAQNYLNTLSTFSADWQAQGQIFRHYSHTGTPTDRSEGIDTYSAILPLFMVNNPKLADELIQTKILPSLQNNEYFEQSDNYYTQNLAWFATLLYFQNTQ